MLKFTPAGIYCVPGRFYIDPWKRVDDAIITHGHADHARGGMNKYLCHHLTLPVLKSRIGPHIQAQGLAYGEVIPINGVNVSLHPAGHIIGSAQVRLEYRGRIVVISGDYKVQDDGLSTAFELVPCHEFITESTFGLPIYRWLPVEEQHRKLQEWVVKNQQDGKNSVLFGYSLGKAQRILKALADVGPIQVHYSIARLNEAFRAAGVPLPSHGNLDLRTSQAKTQGGIYILPPALRDSHLLRKIPDRAEAICSGWMQVRGARRWRHADAGFAISDHADWEELLEVVRGTGAEKIYVTHGQTAVFSRYLRELGLDAVELQTEFGEEETQAELVEEQEERP